MHYRLAQSIKPAIWHKDTYTSRELKLIARRHQWKVIRRKNNISILGPDGGLVAAFERDRLTQADNEEETEET